jgi:hypothetical protein
LRYDRAVVRAASKPFVGPASPTDVGALPRVAQALGKLLPRGEDEKEDPDSYRGLEARRMQAILEAA